MGICSGTSVQLLMPAFEEAVAEVSETTCNIVSIKQNTTSFVAVQWSHDTAPCLLLSGVNVMRAKITDLGSLFKGKQS